MLSRKKERRSLAAISRVLKDGRMVTYACNAYARVYFLNGRYFVFKKGPWEWELVEVTSSPREAYQESQRIYRRTAQYRRKGVKNYDEYAEPWESRRIRRIEDWIDLYGTEGFREKVLKRDPGRKKTARRRRRRSYR